MKQLTMEYEFLTSMWRRKISAIHYDLWTSRAWWTSNGRPTGKPDPHA